MCGSRKTNPELFLLTFLFYHSGEKLEAAEFFSMRVMDEGRVDGLGQDQEQAMDGKEEEVKEQEGPQKQEVGEHPGSKACAQPLHGSVPQRQRVEEREASEEAVLPSLRKKKKKKTTSMTNAFFFFFEMA